jgi:hypothetical protein
MSASAVQFLAVANTTADLDSGDFIQRDFRFFIKASVLGSKFEAYTETTISMQESFGLSITHGIHGLNCQSTTRYCYEVKSELQIADSLYTICSWLW